MSKDEGAEREASCWRSCSERSAARRWRCSTRWPGGKETREYLNDKASEARAERRPTRRAEKGREALNQGRETLTTAIERGREAYQQARRDNA